MSSQQIYARRALDWVDMARFIGFIGFTGFVGFKLPVDGASVSLQCVQMSIITTYAHTHIHTH